MSTTLRAGVIGLGVGEQHAAGYRAHPDCEVAALCDIDAARLADVGRKYPGARLYASADELLDDPDIDVVSIASYDDVHAAQALRAIENGKHVFVEKPLCMRIEELRRIVAALADCPNVRLSCNLILRRSPRLQWLKAAIGRGELGRLFHVEGAYHYGRLHKLTDGWRGRLPHYSVVLGGAVHLVDALLWLTGERVVEVTALGNRIASREAGSRFQHHDMVAALLRFAGGMTGIVTANFGCVMPHGHGLTVHGTRATFINGNPHGVLHASRDPAAAAHVVDIPHPGVGKGELISSFLDSIWGVAEPIIAVDQVVATMAVCLAIEQSNLLGGPVAVEDVAAPDTRRRSAPPARRPHRAVPSP
jgi:predicted dehydrogenase